MRPPNVNIWSSFVFPRLAPKSSKSERKCHISRFPAARMCRQPSSLRRESFSAPASVSVGSPRCKLRSAKRRRKPHRKTKIIQTHSVVYFQEARYIWWTQIFSKKVKVTKLLLVDWLSKMQKCDFLMEKLRWENNHKNMN